MIESHKERLPARCKRAGYPAVIWIEAPLHDNYTDDMNEIRNHFNKTLNKTAVLYDNMWALQLKKVWDTQKWCIVPKGKCKIHIRGFENL